MMMMMMMMMTVPPHAPPLHPPPRLKKKEKFKAQERKSPGQKGSSFNFLDGGSRKTRQGVGCPTKVDLNAFSNNSHSFHLPLNLPIIWRQNTWRVTPECLNT